MALISVALAVCAKGAARPWPRGLLICQLNSLRPLTVKVAASASGLGFVPAKAVSMAGLANGLRVEPGIKLEALSPTPSCTPVASKGFACGAAGTSKVFSALNSAGGLAWTAVSPNKAAKVVSSRPWVRAKATRLPVSGTGVEGVINSSWELNGTASRPACARPSAARSCRPGWASRLPKRLAKSAPCRLVAGVELAAADSPVEADGAVSVREVRFASMWFSRRGFGYQVTRTSGTCTS